MSEETNASAREGAGREPYTPPELKRLGTMAELTQAVASKKVNDGGKGSLKRSQ